MTSLTAADAPDLTAVDADALVLGVMAGGEVTAHPQLPEQARAALTAASAPLEPSPKVGKTTVIAWPGASARRVVLVGVGDGTDADLREAAGSAARACGKHPSAVVLALPALTASARRAVAEGALLGSYRITGYKTGEDADYAGAEWRLAGADADDVDAAWRVASAVLGARDLVNTPPRDLPPAEFADRAVALARAAGVTARVWDEQQLEAEGFGGLVAVGMGSSRPPRLVRLGWEPEGVDPARTVALVGKGITFDSGGLSLKPPQGMETMKSDMSGAAAVLHVVLAAAAARLPVAVTGWLCLAENMPSGTAQRPSDVIRVYGGTTVEVLNTDAEGRLVLADGMVRAREEGPAVLVDVATLTGAQGMALGTRTSGVMGTPLVRDAVVAAADAVAEPMWPMPLPEHLREGFDSAVADLKNIGDRTNGGMLAAGIFLREFAGDTPWAHLDIARPAFNEGPAYGFTVPGATGVAVRTLLRFLEDSTGA